MEISGCRSDPRALKCCGQVEVALQGQVCERGRLSGGFVAPDLAREGPSPKMFLRQLKVVLEGRPWERARRIGDSMIQIWPERAGAPHRSTIHSKLYYMAESGREVAKLKVPVGPTCPRGLHWDEAAGGKQSGFACPGGSLLGSLSVRHCPWAPCRWPLGPLGFPWGGGVGASFWFRELGGHGLQ